MEFFFQLEIKVREYLPKLSSQKNGKETIVSELAEDNDIQFHWCLISTSIDDETASQQLLSNNYSAWQGGNSWGRLGGAVAPPTFGQQHFFRGFHTPLTERYHQKWC